MSSTDAINKSQTGRMRRVGTVGLLLTVGIVLIWWTLRRADRDMRRDLIQQTELVAQSLDLESIRSLKGTDEDLNNPAYLLLTEQLKNILAIKAEWRWLYLMGQHHDGAIFFFLDSEPALSEGHAPPGDLYDEAPESFFRVFKTRHADTEGPYTDRWGTFISSMVPITDPSTNDVLSVLAIDIDAKNWKIDLAARVALPLGLLVALMIGLIAIMFSLRRIDSSPKPVLQRLMPPLSAILLVLMIGSGTLMTRLLRDQLNEFSIRMQNETTGKLSSAISHQTHWLSILADVLIHDNELVSALKSRNLDMLRNITAPVFENQKINHTITHLSFIDSQRICILRVHQPQESGDQVDRFTIREAERTGNRMTGVEVGSDGSLTLWIVQPVFEDNALIGYLEIGKDITDLLTEIHRNIGTELALTLRKTLVNRSLLEARFPSIGSNNWDLYPDDTMVFSTLSSFPVEVGRRIDRSRRTRGTSYLEYQFNNTFWHIMTNPVRDVLDRDVGDLIVMHDVSALKAMHNRIINIAIGFGIALFAGLFAILVVLLRRTDKGIRIQQEQLRQSEMKHRLLTEHAVSAIAVHEIVVDTDGKPVDYIFLSANQAFEQHTGLRVEQVIGRRVTEVLPGIEKTPFIQIYGKVALSGESISFEQYSQPLNRHYLINAYRLREGQFATVFSDITAQKTAEAALRASETNFRSLFESMDDILIICSLDGQILHANRAINRKLGYSFEDLKQLGIPGIHPEDKQTQAQDALAAILRGDATTNPLPLQKRDGSLIPVETRIWHGTWNDTHCIYWMSKDISAEQDAQQRFEGLFRSNPALMALSTYPERRFYDVNDAFLNTLGYSKDEIIGKTSDDLELIFDPKRHETFTDELRRNGRIVNVEQQIKRKDGMVIDGLFSGEIINNQGQQFLLTVMIDMTETKRLAREKERFEAQYRLLQKSESLSRMAGGVAHIFNNQLHGVLNYLELAMDDIVPKEKSKRFLSEAMRAANRAAEVSGLMLTYLGQTPSKHEPLDVSEACRLSLPVIKSTLPERVILKADLPSPGPQILANAHQFHQVLINLLTNASEALVDQRGTIYLRVTTVTASEIPSTHRVPPDWTSQHVSFVCVSIEDTGTGIAEKDIETLFDPFFSRKFTGRGLGLSVVLGIIKAHQGVIAVESELGKGSTFGLYFPLSLQKTVQPVKQDTPLPEYKDEGTVLIVEDEPAILDVARVALERLGFSVLEAKDGIEAVEAYQTHRNAIRLVLCNLSMPRLDGWGTLTALRAFDPNLPVILASGHDESTVMSEDHPDKPQVFLQRPYHTQDLRNAIHRALKSERRSE